MRLKLMQNYRFCVFLMGIVLLIIAMGSHHVLAQINIDSVFDSIPGGSITNLSWVTRNETLEITWYSTYDIYNRKSGIQTRDAEISAYQQQLTTDEYAAFKVAKSETNGGA